MTDLDRGAYTPHSESPLAFDPRAPRRRRPVPVTLILSVLILLALIVALVLIYRSGVRGDGEAPKPVGEPVGAIREAPPPEAQPADPAASLNVYTDEGPVIGAAPAFVPPPEEPIARPAPAAAAPAPVAAAPVRPAAPAPAPARPAPTPPVVRPTPVTPTPAPAAPAPTRPTPTPTPTPAASGGSVVVQIAATATREQAQAMLDRVAGGRATRIEPVERGGQTLYRAQILGFPSRAAAQSFCAASAPGCLIR